MTKAKVFAFLIVLFLSQDCFSQTVCSYSYRKRITFDATKVAGSSDLTNFTALISITTDNDLRSTGNGGHVSSTSGFDIIFVSEDGVTKLDHQLERYTATTGELVAWVRIPNLSTSINTYIYMYYGNSGATGSDQSVTSTWSSAYKGVWHLNNSTTDGTSSGNNGTNSGTSNTVTAKIAGGRLFSGAGTNYLQVPLSGANGGGGNGSISFWGKVSSYTTSTYFFGETTGQTGTYVNRVQLYLGDASGRLYLGIGGTHALQTNIVTMSLNTWYHVMLTWASTGTATGTYSIFVNGASAGTGSYSAFSAIHTFADLGNDGNASQRTEELPGQMDEVRITNTTLNSNWVATEYANQNSPSTFYSISAEPNVFLGTTNGTWNTNSNWSSGTAPSASTDVIIFAGSNQPTLNQNIQLNSLWIRTSNTLSINNSQNLSVSYDILNCGVLTGSGANSLVQLNGTSASIPTQYLSGGGTYSLRDLTVNNTHTSNPTVVLNSSVSITDDLTLTSGIVSTTTTNILALGTGATSTSGSATSYVSGPMSKDGNAAFVFPVGKGGRWRRIGISAPTASTTFRAEYFNTAYTNTSTVNSPITDVSKLEYWQLDRTVGTGNASLSLYWESATASGIDNCTDLTIVRFNGTGWDERAASTTTSSSCSGSGTGIVTTTAVVTAFSPFTFGSKSLGVNPLPIELIEFKAECIGTHVKLSWSSASEKNCDYYYIQKSIDAKEWIDLGKVKAIGNTSSIHQYEISDEPDSEKEFYYRLIEIDKDKRKSIFETVSLACDKGIDKMEVYPNPASNLVQVKLSLSSNYGIGIIKLVDNLGRVCYEKSLTFSRGTQILALPLTLTPGSYIVVIESATLRLPVQRLIVR